MAIEGVNWNGIVLLVVFMFFFLLFLFTLS